MGNLISLTPRSVYIVYTDYVLRSLAPSGVLSLVESGYLGSCGIRLTGILWNQALWDLVESGSLGSCGIRLSGILLTVEFDLGVS